MGKEEKKIAEPLKVKERAAFVSVSFNSVLPGAQFIVCFRERRGDEKAQLSSQGHADCNARLWKIFEKACWFINTLNTLD